MQEISTERLKKYISAKRFDGYMKRIEKKYGPCSSVDCYAYYSWNIALSESLYTPLHALEVALRNSIHDNARTRFKDDFWFENSKYLVQPHHRDMVAKAKKRLTGQRKRISSGRIVAELSLGFWTGLFNVRYNRTLWPLLLKGVFPGMRPEIRTQPILLKRLEKIRYLRNRVFHYEPIWHYNDLSHQHGGILEAIRWIEPAMESLVIPIDRFPACYKPSHLETIKSELKDRFVSGSI